MRQGGQENMHHVDPTPRRARLRALQYRLTDGRVIGLTVGGSGVPLVFLHGIGMSNRAYKTVLGELAAQGFLVIAVDAAGHGESPPLATANDDWVARVAVVDQLLRELGVRKAVVAGHSMGGRKAVALTALDPERVIAALLLSPATGPGFDKYKSGPGRPGRAIRGLSLAVFDTLDEMVRHRSPGPGWSAGMAASLVRSTLRHPRWLREAMHAIVYDGSGGGSLQALKAAGVPVVVIHGRRDLVIHFRSAEATARSAGATLIELPDARHSWMIASPHSLSMVLSDLVANELAAPLALAAIKPGFLDPGNELEKMLPEFQVSPCPVGRVARRSLLCYRRVA